MPLKMDRLARRRSLRTIPLFLIVLLQATATRTAADPIDVLRVLELSEGMEGVALDSGLCTNRKGVEVADLAYRINRRIQLSAPTKQLFPESPFPEDFSLMTTLRATKDTQFFLLSVYDQQGAQQLGLEVGRSPVFLYEDHQGLPLPEDYPTFKKINLADGKWHRIAYSVQGKTVTLYVDCEKVETLDLLRGDAAVVSTEGVTVFGTRLMDEEVFEGEIQQLLIAEDPLLAEDYCLKYIPDCDSPLPYNTQIMDKSEEDRPLKRPVVEEYSDSDLYDDLSVSTVTVGPNVTDYEMLEYEDLKNATSSEYEEYEIYEDAYSFAERDLAQTWDGEVNGFYTR